jgi:hypothetical protein
MAWLELAGFYALTAGIIWAGPLVHWRPPGAVAALLLIGWLVFFVGRRGWNAEKMGWGRRWFRPACKAVLTWAGPFLLLGMLTACLRPWPSLQRVLYGERGAPPAWALAHPGAVVVLGLLRYPLWALVQETMLLSYLANRWRDALGERPWLVASVNGALFALLHAPNPILMPVCLVSGTLLTRAFLKAPHLVPPALVHGFGGLLVSLLFWQHPGAMTVGPSYWTLR